MRAPDKPGVTQPDRDPRRRARRRTPTTIEREFEGRGYGDLKTAVGDEVAAWLAPVRERYAELRADEAALEAILAEGAERRARSPRPIVADVRDAMGVGPARRSVGPAA